MALCQFIYGVIKKHLCLKRVAHVQYISIDDLVITTPLKKTKQNKTKQKQNDIAALWSCSGRPGSSLLVQNVVASLLSLCMAK